MRIGQLGKSFVRLGALDSPNILQTGAVSTVAGAHRQPGVHRRRLHDRSGTGVAEFFGQRAGLGLAGPAADVFPGPAAADLPAGRFGERRRLGRAGGSGVALHRPAGRGGRHDGGRGLHAVPHGQEPDREPGPGARGSAARRAAARNR